MFMVINFKKNDSFLLLYKSTFFKYFKFETDSNDIQDIIIVKALNIKNRKKRITFIYDSTCDYIDNFYKNKNICGFKNCQCYVQRKNNNNLKNGCCRKCIYITDNGCVTKNLACKLFNCSEVYCRRKVIKFEDLRILKLLSLRQRLIIKADYFSLREDVLKNLYSYSIIYSTIRIVIRLLNNIVTLYRKENN